MICQLMICLLWDCRGATIIEYGFTASLIAIAMEMALSALGSKIGQVFNNVSSNL